ncbi:MAG: hypothetical protein OEM52_04655, partial [bacterium]|nr:hypothetical protein [bacterium]
MRKPIQILLLGFLFPLVSGGVHLTHAKALSPTSQTVPKPFFFTENKGQWDARVLYKCQAKNGMTWFLERDGITLLLMQQGDRELDFGVQGRGGSSYPPADPVRRTFLSDDYSSRGRPSGSPNENDLPEMLRRHPARENVPMKSHALKFKFLKGEGSKVKGEGSNVNGAREAKEDSENLFQSFSTQHPTPYTLNPSPDFLHPTPYTLHLSPFFSIPFTLH